MSRQGRTGTKVQTGERRAVDDRSETDAGGENDREEVSIDYEKLIIMVENVVKPGTIAEMNDGWVLGSFEFNDKSMHAMRDRNGYLWYVGAPIMRALGFRWGNAIGRHVSKENTAA